MRPDDDLRPLSPSAEIDRFVASLGDWRGETLARLRAIIREADPEAVESLKWMRPSSPGTPTWEHEGIVCTAGAFKGYVKLTFARGAELPDPHGLFNAGFGGKTRRAIDIREGEFPDPGALRDLVRAAVALNKARRRARVTRSDDEPTEGATSVHRRMLAGGNPQIPKCDGEEAVRAYIEALDGWKRDVVEGLDAIVTRTVPQVRKAIRWNSPFYRVEGNGWFASVHCFTSFVKVTFFAGASLSPPPPGNGKSPTARWVDIQAGGLDPVQLEEWVRQAAALPGWNP